MDVQQVTAWVQFVSEVLIAIGVGYNTLQSLRARTERKELSVKQGELVATVTAVKETVGAVSVSVGDVKTQVAEVHEATNGMRAALVAATEQEALARGIATGVAQEKARVDKENGKNGR